MTPNKCKCNWIPSVAYKTDPMWGYTTGFYVICEHCTRRGSFKPTKDEAIKSWNDERRMQNETLD